MKDVVVLEEHTATGTKRRVELRSRNPDFPPIVFSSASELEEVRPIAELVEVLGHL